MDLDWTHFTPWTSLAGGMLIGLGAALLVLLNGRIAGISGIVGGLLSARPGSGEAPWRLAFLAGLLAAPLLWRWAGTLPTPRIDVGWAALVGAGLLVGVGTRYAAGCTSGHGVCGLSRLSPRSAVATAVFVAAGVVTVYAIRHGIGA